VGQGRQRGLQLEHGFRPDNGALHAVLVSLGFCATRGMGTMRADPAAPPTHGTVLVTCEETCYVVRGIVVLDGLEQPQDTRADETLQAERGRHIRSLAWDPESIKKRYGANLSNPCKIILSGRNGL
jgi:hypothetical protein